PPRSPRPSPPAPVTAAGVSLPRSAQVRATASSPSPSWSLCPNSVGDRFEVIRYLRAFDRLLVRPVGSCRGGSARPPRPARQRGGRPAKRPRCRSEEHTSELQSRLDLV